MRWFYSPSAGHMVGSGDHSDVRQTPCVSADPLIKAGQPARLFETDCCSEQQAMELGYWGVKDRNHEENTAAPYCNFGESRVHLQDMLLGAVVLSLERLGFAAHSPDANWRDIEGAEQADNWAEDIRSFYDHLSEHCNPYQAVRSVCCLHPKRNCRSSKSTARSQSVHLFDHLGYYHGHTLDCRDFLHFPCLYSHWGPCMVGNPRDSFEKL